ncbi:AP-3 complex subunit delta-1 [Phlyctochytrium planicorne]|nr:AP-3 complex subunit delta-1 [Phlyctochytrium planicorne]
MFEKNLTALIRGIRSNKNNEDQYIRNCLDEIRNEVRRNDIDIKAQAVTKLFYLHMIGYDMSWASFHVIEVMSSAKYVHKRIGYIAAATSFRPDTDVLMLCTNLIKKSDVGMQDLSSNNYLETALALNGLAAIATPDLGRDLTPDLVAMLNHSRPYIRKRVILVLYKVFLKYPESLRIAFPRLKEKLEDPDPSVVSAAVNVICELARRNPKSYLPLAPQLYSLLTNSSNNWMLIKIIKLFGALVPLEPRLIKKLVPPITNLIQTTQAMSLLYECIQTVILGGMIAAEKDGVDDANDSALARLCVSKLKLFIEDADQNLKYLGLHALCKLLPLRPRVVTEHREIVLECLDDKDISIRMRALELLTGMVTKKNLPDIVKRLMLQLLPPAPSAEGGSLGSSLTSADKSYSKEVIERILGICSKDTYEMISDFEWYITILSRLAKVPFVTVGDKISAQLVDICVRVKSVREFAVNQMIVLLNDSALMDSASMEENNADVIYAAAWICSEYSNRSFVTDKQALVSTLTSDAILKLPFSIQAICVHAALKLFASWTSSESGDLELNSSIYGLILSLQKFESSSDIEVQERASTSRLLLNYIHERTLQDGNGTPEIVALRALFGGELNPVAPNAQKRVPVPEGLDLDAWIFEPKVVLLDTYNDEEEDDGMWTGSDTKKYTELIESDEVKSERRQQREAQRRNDPYYIPSAQDDVDNIPIVKLTLDDLPDPVAKPKKIKKKSKKKENELVNNLPDVRQVTYEINKGFEMPENVGTEADEAELLDDLERRRKAAADDPDTLAVLSVDLSGLGGKSTFEDGRAAILSSDLQAKATNQLLITRKRVDSDSPVKKTKAKKEKAATVDGSEVKKKKKKKTTEADGEEKPRVKKVKTKAKKEASGTTEPASPAVVSPTSLIDIADGPVPVVELDLSERSVFVSENLSLVYSFESDFDAEHSLLVVKVVLESHPTNLATVPPFQLSLLSTSPVICSPDTSLLASTTLQFDALNSKSSVVLHIPLSSEPILVAPPTLTVKVECPENTSLDGEAVLQLPVSIYLKNPTAVQINPTEFAAQLATTSLFPFSSSSQFAIDSPADFSKALDIVVKRLGVATVEVVSEAVSVYSQTFNGIHVAGLIKHRQTKGRTGSKSSISVDLKSGDQALLGALLEDLSLLEF